MLRFSCGPSRRGRNSSRRFSRSSRFTSAKIAEVEFLENRLVLSPGILAVGAGVGSVPQVKVFDSASGAFLYDIFPYSDVSAFAGGVRTAVADVDGDGAFDVITAPGPGTGPLIRIFSGAVPGQLFDQFFAYNPGFFGGVYVAATDFNGDGFSEIVTGAGQGGGPHVRVFGSGGFFNDFVFAPGFSGGVRVATGDVSGDTVPDLIVAAGPGGGPHVRVLNGTNGLQLAANIGSFFAYDAAFRGGVYVASANLGGTNVQAEVVTGAGEGGGPHVRIIDPTGAFPNIPSFDLNFTTTQFPFNPALRGGVRVGAAYVDNIDTIGDLIVGTGPGTVSDLRIFRGATAVEYYGLFPYDASVTGGIFPSSGKFLSEPLRLADQDSPPAESPDAITAEDAETHFQFALARLDQGGLPASLRQNLQTLEIQVADLPGDLLGVAQPGRVVLDHNGGGYGWFLDPTPLLDEEFDGHGLAPQSEAQSGIDLLTVLLHESGHHLGLGHDLMAETLTVGQRRFLDPHVLDTVFANGEVLDL